MDKFKREDIEALYDHFNDWLTNVYPNMDSEEDFFIGCRINVKGAFLIRSLAESILKRNGDPIKL